MERSGAANSGAESTKTRGEEGGGDEEELVEVEGSSNSSCKE